MGFDAQEQHLQELAGMAATYRLRNMPDAEEATRAAMSMFIRAFNVDETWNLDWRNGSRAERIGAVIRDMVNRHERELRKLIA